jgi:hypothetical protein
MMLLSGDGNFPPKLFCKKHLRHETPGKPAWCVASAPGVSAQLQGQRQTRACKMTRCFHPRNETDCCALIGVRTEAAAHLESGEGEPMLAPAGHGCAEHESRTHVSVVVRTLYYLDCFQDSVAPCNSMQACNLSCRGHFFHKSERIHSIHVLSCLEAGGGTCVHVPQCPRQLGSTNVCTALLKV